MRRYSIPDVIFAPVNKATLARTFLCALVIVYRLFSLGWLTSRQTFNPSQIEFTTT